MRDKPAEMWADDVCSQHSLGRRPAAAKRGRSRKQLRSFDAVLGRFSRKERKEGTNLFVIVAVLQCYLIFCAVWRNERTEATAKGADGARAAL